MSKSHTQNSTLNTQHLITLAHGAGGETMRRLIDEVFVAGYGGDEPARDDSAVLDLSGHGLAFTTDSFVVDPIFFPGGDIGRLAVAGTVNDLLTAAAKPIAISAAFIIEEGFEIGRLEAIVASMARTAQECGVRIVTGDTKVVPRGSADKLFITTSGVGKVLRAGVSGASARAGDKVILTGSIGDHGTAVMLARERLLDAESIESDAAPLTEIVMNLIDAGIEIRAMRDPTRGGGASALNEIAAQSGVMIEIDESQVPIKPAVSAACEAIGIEPFHMANEGKMLIITTPNDAEKALLVTQSSRYGREARIIGEVGSYPPGRVQVRTTLGTSRILRQITGEALPRIC